MFHTPPRIGGVNVTGGSANLDQKALHAAAIPQNAAPTSSVLKTVKKTLF